MSCTTFEMASGTVGPMMKYPENDQVLEFYKAERETELAGEDWDCEQTVNIYEYEVDIKIMEPQNLDPVKGDTKTMELSNLDFPQMDMSLDISAISEIVEEESLSERQTIHQCAECSYTSNFKHNLTRHSRTHRNTKTSTPVKQPRSTVTSVIESKKYVCDQCGNSYKSSYGLRLHIKSIHEQIFKYKCQICGKGFNQVAHYRGHCARHLSVALEKCEFCGKEFHAPGTLSKHSKICKENPNHQEHSKFLCNVCSSSFATRDGLRSHQRGKHQPPRYQCSKCLKWYAWRSSLRAHVKISHPL